jgi:bifunctional DNA primase/polymerase-like protein
LKSFLSEEQKNDVLFWPEIAGIGILPADTKNKKIYLKSWTEIDLSTINYRAELDNGLYDNGIAIRTGKTISGKYFLVAIDFDGIDAVIKWFGSWERVLEIAKQTRIEWHGDKWRLHMFLLANRPVKNKRLQIKDSLLEFKCERQALFVSPSIHKTGNPYSALNTGEIAIINENQLLQLESKIDSLSSSDGYMSDENKQAYIRWLEDPENYTKLGVGQGRHNGLVTLGTSYYNRYTGDWKDYTDERRREKLWDWNAKLAVPLSQKEFDDVWKWIVDKHRRTRDEQHEKLREERRPDPGNPILNQLEESVRKELSAYTFELLSYSPLTFVIAHNTKKQTLHGRINITANSNDNDNYTATSSLSASASASTTFPQTFLVQRISYDSVIINAIPTKIIKYEDPTNIETKYEIEFETPLNYSFHVEPKSIKDILEILKQKALVYKLRAAEEALPAILNAYQRDGKVVVKREVETPGFYLVNGNIFANKTGDTVSPSVEQVKSCAIVLSELAKRSRRQEIFATFVMWGVVAPFSYVFKQLDEDGHEKWMPWIYNYGQTNTGKTTYGRIVLSIWGKHKDKKIHDIGFSNTDTIPRFGRAVSYDTFPILINEVTLNDDRQKQLVEALKHSVQSQTARGRLATRSTAEYISALSPCILTGNPPPPEDPAFIRRFIRIYSSTVDQHTEEEIKEFNEFLSANINTLKILGDFTIDYLLKHQAVIVKDDWKTIGTTVLREFFKFGDIEIPEWVGKFIQDSDVQDIYAEQEQLIRGFFIKKINDTYSRFFNTLATEDKKMDKTLNLNKLENRLWFCYEKEQLIPYIRTNKTGDKILILPDIMSDLKANRITCVTNFTDLAEMFQTKPEPKNMNKRTVRLISISKQKFLEFLLPPVSEQ